MILLASLAVLPLVPQAVAAPIPVVAADVQPASVQLTWDLFVDGQPAGTRSLVIRPADAGGSARVLEVWTELRFQAAGIPFHLQQRVTGLGEDGPIPFASADAENGHPREVQLVRHASEWLVTLAEDGVARRYKLPPDAFDFTSLNLLDPASFPRIAQRSYLRVMLAESGRIVEGPFRSTGPVALRIGGQTVQGEAFAWSLPDDEMELVYDREGHLLEARWTVAGVRVQATLRELPPPPDWGEPLPQPVVSGTIEEEPL